MSNQRFASSVLSRPSAGTLALLVALVAAFYTFAAGATPCANAAQCNVGDSETFTNDTTFSGEINVGATPGPGSSGQILTSGGADASPEWLTGTTFLTKAADETITSDSTINSDPAFNLATTSGSRYWVDGLLYVNSGTTPDFKFQLGGDSFDGAVYAPSTGAWSGFTEAAAKSIGTTGADEVIVFRGILVSAGTDFNIAWSQDTSDAGSTILRAGSSVSITEIITP